MYFSRPLLLSSSLLLLLVFISLDADVASMVAVMVVAAAAASLFIYFSGFLTKKQNKTKMSSQLNSTQHLFIIFFCHQYFGCCSGGCHRYLAYRISFYHVVYLFLLFSRYIYFFVC